MRKPPGIRFKNPTELLNAMPAITAAVNARRRVTRKFLQKVSLAASGLGTGGKPPARLGPKKISLARLPVTGSDVFGRQEDIAFLDRAWANQDINVVTIVAWAGGGKSTLVNHWLRRMAAKHYRSAELVFAWSFYRQGSTGDTSSADEFLEAKSERITRFWIPATSLMVSHAGELLKTNGRLRGCHRCSMLA